MPIDRYDEGSDRMKLIRLLAEGAEEMFDTAQPLYRLGLKNNAVQAAVAFDLVGVALTEIRQGIQELQEGRIKDAKVP